MINLVVPYNPDWKTEFEKIKTTLETVLNGFEISIQHVGSTAIPGLCAKPILDIDIVLVNKTYLQKLSAILEKIGYINKGEQGIAGRFAFRQQDEYTPITSLPQKWPSHHLYVCFSDSLALENHLFFRNALLQDKELVDKYSKLKFSLMKEKGMTRELYNKRKTRFIVSVLQACGFDEKKLNEIMDANL